MKKKLTREKNEKCIRAHVFLKIALCACVFLLLAEKTLAFDIYSVSIIKGHFVIEIDKCSYRERLQRNKTGYETKDVVKRALQACKKV